MGADTEARGRGSQESLQEGLAGEGGSSESDIKRTTSDMAWRDIAREVTAARGPSLPASTLHHLGPTPPSEAVLLPRRAQPPGKVLP